MDELRDCVSDADSVERTVSRRELIKAVNAFVRRLPASRRAIFIRRYWYADPVADIAKGSGMTPGNVSKALKRTRKQLKKTLTEGGFEI